MAAASRLPDLVVHKFPIVDQISGPMNGVTSVGQLVLGVVGILFAGAFFWLNRMRAVESPGRIFAKVVSR